MKQKQPWFFDENEIAGKRISNNIGIEDDPCILCGLFRGCRNPKIKPYGKGKKGILIVGEAPGSNEDKVGVPFVGDAGKYLGEALNKSRIDMDKDCRRTNVLGCRPPENKFLTDKVPFCYDRLDSQINLIKPNLIMTFGAKATSRILEAEAVSDSILDIQGDVFPSRKYNCWVSVNLHPSFVMRDKKMYNKLFVDSIKKGLFYIDREIPESILNSGKNKLLEGNEAIKVLRKLSASKKPVCFDYEANQLSPFIGSPKIIMISLSVSSKVGYVIYFGNDKVEREISKFLSSPAPKIAHSSKFEDLWTRFYFDHPVNNWYNDTLLSAHVLDERRNTKSLAFQAFLYVGEEYKEMVNRSDIESASRENQIKYSSLDSRYPVMITKGQVKKLKYKKLSFPAKLLLKGTQAFSDMEERGVKVDWDEFDSFKGKVNEKLVKSSDYLADCKLARKFYDKHNRTLNHNSTDDLKLLFFEDLKLKPLSETDKGNPQVNDELFSMLESREGKIGNFVKALQVNKKMSKLKKTYLNAIETYTDRFGFIHPNFNLGLVRTYRSSCDNPNLQNIPKHDKFAQQIRRIFIPSYDYFYDTDYSGMEVRIIGMCSKDKNLCKQIRENFDPHGYWAKKLFETNELKGDMRFQGKTGFVFPEFYGSYYITIAREMGLKEIVVQEVENEFWDMYYGVKNWQGGKFEEYKKKGYVSTPLGFIRHAPLNRNKIINTPIQSTAFHFLLDAMIRAGKIMKREGFMSHIVLQIHDELLIDIVDKESSQIRALVTECMLEKPWKFAQGVPLACDWKKGANWYDLEAVA